METLRQQIYWFWHELSHFITAIGRGQLWWAYGQLEAMRVMCLNLARLGHSYADTVGGGGAVLQGRTGASQRAASVFAGDLLSNGAKGNVPGHSHHTQLLPENWPGRWRRRHGLTYPAELDRLMVDRLETLSHTGFVERKSGGGQMMHLSSVMIVLE